MAVNCLENALVTVQRVSVSTAALPVAPAATTEKTPDKFLQGDFFFHAGVMNPLLSRAV